jgi:hypothetical protein
MPFDIALLAVKKASTLIPKHSPKSNRMLMLAATICTVSKLGEVVRLIVILGLQVFHTDCRIVILGFVGFIIMTAARRVEFSSSSKEKRDQWVEAINTRHDDDEVATPAKQGRRSIMASSISLSVKEGWLWCRSVILSEAQPAASWIKHWAVLKGATLKMYSRNDLMELESTHALVRFAFKADSGANQQQSNGENLYLFRIIPPKRTYAFSPDGEFRDCYLEIERHARQGVCYFPWTLSYLVLLTLSTFQRVRFFACPQSQSWARLYLVLPHRRKNGTVGYKH